MRDIRQEDGATHILTSLAPDLVSSQGNIIDVAIGPVFATSSKQVPDPVVGLEGVRAARALTHKPLVAIGGITRANCAAVIEAGADSVAVISDLIQNPGKSVEEFLSRLGDHSLP